MTLSVGFIGLGDQGAPMARAIAADGWSLSVWARRRESLKALSGIEHRVCSDVSELGRTCDLVGLCLRDDKDLEEILLRRGLLASMKPGSIVANHATGSPDLCPEMENWGAEYGVHVLDAPVSGGRVGAETRTLTVMIGGNVEAFQRGQPVFASFSTSSMFLGPSGSGQIAKLVNNVVFAANLNNVCELLRLASDLNIDSKVITDLVLASSGSSFALETMVRNMSADLAGHYSAMLLKDLRCFDATLRARGAESSRLVDWARQGVAGLRDGIRALSDPLRESTTCPRVRAPKS